jgi:regulator of nucleoside diphosphate kinase
MNNKPIQISEFDLKRLQKLIDDAHYGAHRGSSDYDRLKAELDRAQVVSPQSVSHTVITMNSTIVLLDLDTGEEETYTLVFPEQASIEHGRISILAPIGTAMLGYEVGDIFEWEVPDGQRRLQVTQILYQPESAGDYHL